LLAAAAEMDIIARIKMMYAKIVGLAQSKMLYRLISHFAKNRGDAYRKMGIGYRSDCAENSTTNGTELGKI
jgi:hypothetical protein